ncbi:MAG: hypothetical protein Q8L29_03105 [archaeon]|nr:hypothetical protein [archaeon]
MAKQRRTLDNVMRDDPFGDIKGTYIIDKTKKVYRIIGVSYSTKDGPKSISLQTADGGYYHRKIDWKAEEATPEEIMIYGSAFDLHCREMAKNEKKLTPEEIKAFELANERALASYQRSGQETN